MGAARDPFRAWRLLVTHTSLPLRMRWCQVPCTPSANLVAKPAPRNIVQQVNPLGSGTPTFYGCVPKHYPCQRSLPDGGCCGWGKLFRRESRVQDKCVSPGLVVYPHEPQQVVLHLSPRTYKLCWGDLGDDVNPPSLISLSLSSSSISSSRSSSSSVTHEKHYLARLIRSKCAL